MACATGLECIAPHRRCEIGGLFRVKNVLFAAFFVKNAGKWKNPTEFLLQSVVAADLSETGRSMGNPGTLWRVPCSEIR